MAIAVQSTRAMRNHLVLGLLLLAGPAFAGGGANVKQLPAHIQAARTTPLQLSATKAAAQQAAMKKLMLAEIEGNNGYELHGSDTPVMGIVPLQGELKQTRIPAVQHDYDRDGGHGAEYVASSLPPGAKMKVRLLLPVSAHYGLPYKQYAETNEYDVFIEDHATGKELSRTRVKANGNLVTEVDVDLPLDNHAAVEVSFSPTATGRGGFPSGRHIVVRRDP